MTSSVLVLQNDPNQGLRTRLERNPESESISVSSDFVDLQAAVRERLEIREAEPSRSRRPRR